jgi:hypothetical protein
MDIKISPEQVESWVAKYFDYRTRKGGDELLICNPFDGDTGYHFNISTVKTRCNDWRSNAWVGYNPKTGKRMGCTFLRFVQLYLEQLRGSCSFTAAVSEVLGSASSARALMRARKSHEQKKAQEEAFLCLPDHSVELMDSATNKVGRSLLSWLYSRCIDERKIRKYKVMHSGFDIVWPYYEYEELVYWQSRSRLGKKFLFPPESVGSTKGEFLYGYDQVEPASYLVIVEAILCCQTLEEQTLASGGAILTDQQVKKLRIFGPTEGVILAPDNDIAGLESVLTNATKLRRYALKIYFSIPPALSYVIGGETKYTKDWNDIARYTNEDPKKIFEKNVEPFGARANLDIRTRIDKKRQSV